MKDRGNIALIGWGAIGRRVAHLLAQGDSGAAIVAVGVSDADQPRDGLPDGAAVIDNPADLARCGASLVVEAAGRESVAPWGTAALSAGLDFAVSSTSAFADRVLLGRLTALARQNDAQLLIPPGALGGIDALSAARRMGLSLVEHRIVKPSHAWQGTPAEALCDLQALTAPYAFFTGSAEDAAAEFPQNANVAMITALAGVGALSTQVTLIADPGAQVNRHEIRAAGAFGDLSVTLANAPLADNPKSSAMTALNLVRLIENRVAPLVI